MAVMWGVTVLVSAAVLLALMQPIQASRSKPKVKRGPWGLREQGRRLASAGAVTVGVVVGFLAGGTSKVREDAQVDSLATVDAREVATKESDSGATVAASAKGSSTPAAVSIPTDAGRQRQELPPKSDSKAAKPKPEGGLSATSTALEDTSDSGEWR